MRRRGRNRSLVVRPSGLAHLEAEVAGAALAVITLVPVAPLLLPMVSLEELLTRPLHVVF
jgi:hypothetical protein